jgi:hypothetical protein
MSSIKSKNEIRAVLILEILGRPKEHLVETLNNYIDKMNSEPGVVVENKKINEPTIVKDQKDLYTTYAEIEIKVEEAFLLILLTFKYMPSHIEVLSPDELILTHNDYNDMLNEITRRLHGYDEVAKILQFEKNALTIKLKEFEEKSKSDIIILDKFKEENIKKEKKKKF